MFHNLIEIRNKKKIPLLWSFICMVLCCTLLIGTSYAWFSDAVTSGTNRIQAGSLKVGLSYKTYVLKEGSTVESKSWTDASSTADVLNNAHYEPGFVSLTFFKIENKGDLSLKYQLALLKDAQNPERAGRNVLGETFKLSDYLTFDFIPLTDNTAIKKSDVENDTVANFTRANALALLGNKDPRSGVDFPYTVENTMLASNNDKEHIVALVTTMPSDVGVAAMYDDAKTAPELKLDFKLGATQWNGESDTFGNDYDEKAIYAEGWSQSVFASGFVSSGLNCYQEEGHRFVTVTGTKSENCTLIVSECNAPVGFEVTADKTYKSYNITLLDSKGKPVSGTDEYEVTIYVGKYLSNVALYHNGKPTSADTSFTFDPADYHADTGYLTFTTKKFSVFTAVGEGAVARIGEDKVYPSIEAAFDAVHNGTEKTATITVMAKETEVTAPLTIKADENITLDLNGCTVKANIVKVVDNKGVLTIKDSSFRGWDAISSGGAMDIAFTNADRLTSSLLTNSGALVIENTAIAVNLVGGGGNFAAIGNNEGTVTIKNAVVSGNLKRTSSDGWSAYFALVNSNKGTVCIEGGQYSASADRSSVFVVRAEGDASVDISAAKMVADGTSDSVIASLGLYNGVSGIVKDTKLSSASSTGQNKCVYLTDWNGALNFNNVEVDASKSTNGSIALFVPSGCTGKVVIDGGTYKSQGVAVEFDNGELTMTNSKIEIDNGTRGMVVGTNGTFNTVKAQLSNCSIVANSSVGSMYAIQNQSINFEMTGCNITAQNDGGNCSGLYNGGHNITSVINKISGCTIDVTAKEVGYGINNSTQKCRILSMTNNTIIVKESTRHACGISCGDGEGNIVRIGTGHYIKVTGPGSVSTIVGNYYIFDSEAALPVAGKNTTVEWSN